MVDVIQDISVAGIGHPDYAGDHAEPKVLSIVEIDPDSAEGKIRRVAQIDMRLQELDKVTDRRIFEAWAKVNGDAFVKAGIAEKEALRAERSVLLG